VSEESIGGLKLVTVRKLISELKKMPQNLAVGVAMHDNSENEVAAWVFSVNEIIEEPPPGESKEDIKRKKCVVLRC
jgi:hypothetical protein